MASVITRPAARPIAAVFAHADFHLWNDGYAVVRGAADRTQIGAIDAAIDEICRDTPFCDGDFYGYLTKRLGRLLHRVPGVAELVLDSEIRSLVSAILDPWCDCIQLNVAQAIEIHPGALAQMPHRDQDMYCGPKGGIEYLVNVMWPLTRFTAINGATRLWPDSHGTAALAPLALDAEPVTIEAEPGDAILFLGSTLHAAGANHCAFPRRGLVLGYSLGWLKPYENPFLAYPPDIARTFSPELAALIGYRQHRPNLGNIDGRCPSSLLGDRHAALMPATDAVRPDQAVLLAAHAQAQRDGVADFERRVAAGAL